jgi:hypothetical protein
VAHPQVSTTHKAGQAVRVLFGQLTVLHTLVAKAVAETVLAAALRVQTGRAGNDLVAVLRLAVR